MGETNEQENQVDYYVSHKLVLLGEVAVGKSSIAQRFVNGKFTNLHQPTIGALFLTKKIHLNDSMIKFDIWDTAGQERYHALTPMYYKNAKAAIVVFDVTNSPSFDRAKRWMTELIEKASPGIIIALCGNKIDLEDSRQIKKEEGEQYANEIGSFYFEVSAKLNTNITELFTQIAEKMPKYEAQNNGAIKLEDDTKKEEKKSCYGYSCYGYSS